MANILTKRKFKKHNKFNKKTKKNKWNRKTKKQVGGAGPGPEPVKLSLLNYTLRRRRAEDSAPPADYAAAAVPVPPADYAPADYAAAAAAAADEERMGAPGGIDFFRQSSVHVSENPHNTNYTENTKRKSILDRKISDFISNLTAKSNVILASDLYKAMITNSIRLEFDKKYFYNFFRNMNDYKRKIDECVTFLNDNGMVPSPKINSLITLYYTCKDAFRKSLPSIDYDLFAAEFPTRTLNKSPIFTESLAAYLIKPPLRNYVSYAFLAYAKYKNFDLEVAFKDEIKKKTKDRLRGVHINPVFQTINNFATAVEDSAFINMKIYNILNTKSRMNIYCVDTENLCMRTVSHSQTVGHVPKNKKNVYRSLFLIAEKNAQANQNNMFIFINHHDYFIPGDINHPEINHTDIFTQVLPNFYIFNKKCGGSCETDDFSLMLLYRSIDGQNKKKFNKFVMSHDNYNWYIEQPIPKAIFHSSPGGDRHIIHNASQEDIQNFYERLF